MPRNQDARGDGAPFEQRDKKASYRSAFAGGAQQGWERLRVEAEGWIQEEWAVCVCVGRDVFCCFLCNLTKARRGNGG